MKNILQREDTTKIPKAMLIKKKKPSLTYLIEYIPPLEHRVLSK